MDSQQVEIVGRNVLVSALVADGLEVAEPLRDHGIDLIVYDDGNEFCAIPLQLKAFRRSAFGIWRKYEHFDRLLIAFVWNASHPSETETYCLTHRECIEVADELGWTSTASWTDKSAYVSTRPSKRVEQLLLPYRMGEGTWRTKLGL